MNLANNLKKIRKDNNLSQEELADKLNVTRQSVSKWESGVAYPEMDKVLQICKMFNVNIDDLFNKDLSEVKEVKESKRIFNKYVDDFVGYITKVINIFSSMKLKDKIKCLLEQLFIILILFIFFFIIGAIGNYVVMLVFDFLPDAIYRVIYSVLEGIYIIIGLCASILLLVHAFKVRYMDYYVFEEKGSKKDEVIETKTSKPQEKIVIRDPKYSGYNIVSGIAKIIMFFVKLFLLCVFAILCFSLVAFCASLIISFIFVKTGLLFIGAFLAIISCIIINIVMLILIFNFIVNRKNKFILLFMLFITSLLIFGAGMGMAAISIKDVKVESNRDNYIIEKAYMHMDDELWVSATNVDYVIQDRSDIKVEMVHSKYNNILVHYDHGNNEMYFTYDHVDIKDAIANLIEDINNKTLYEYDYSSITIYGNANDIAKLKDNSNNKYMKRY